MKKPIHLILLLTMALQPIFFYAQTTVDTSALFQKFLTIKNAEDWQPHKKAMHTLLLQDSRAAFRLTQKVLLKTVGKEQLIAKVYAQLYNGIALLELGKTDAALVQLKQCGQLAEQLGLQKIICQVKLNIAIFHINKQQYQDAFQQLDQSEECAANLNEAGILAKIKNARGEALRMQGEYEKAVPLLQEVLDYFTKNNNPMAASPLNSLAAIRYLQEDLVGAADYFMQARDMAAQYQLLGEWQTYEANLGFLYLRLEQFDKARPALLSAYRLAERQGRLSGISHAAYNLGEFYFQNEQPDSAEHFAKVAMTAAQKIGDAQRVAGASLILTDVALQAGDLQNAQKYVQQAAAAANESEDIFISGYSYFTQGQVAENLGKDMEAIRFFQKALGVFEQTNERSVAAETHTEIAKIHEKRGDYQQALAAFKIAQQLEDSIQQTQQAQQIAALEKDFALEKKEVEIDFLKKENELKNKNLRKNRWVILALIGLLLLGSFVSVLLYRQRKLVLEKETAEVKQQLLRQQMNPHFVFNALNAIQNYFLTGDAETSVLLMGQFSRLMRSVLNNSNETFVSIHDELELLRLYLDIEQLRTDRKFDYEINVDSEVDIHHTQLPSMVTQIFVENAIWHGIAPKKGKGLISLNVAKQNGHTIFTVRDDGVGRKYSMQRKTPSQKSHRSIGTSLVKERIHQINRKFSKNIRLLIEDAPTDGYDGTKVALVF